MKLLKQNMWNDYEKSDLFLFTANGVVGDNDKLVMGAGMAKQVRDKFPGIDLKIGQGLVGDFPWRPCTFRFYLLISEHWPRAKVGAFQTKLNWKDKASSLELIEVSTRELIKFCRENKPNHVCLNFPGIGLGGLDEKEVLPIIEKLPDCVYIYKLG